MDVLSSWPAVGSIAAVASAGVAAVAAWQSRQSAGTLAAIERERFRRELAPVFRVRCEAGYPMPGFAVLFILLADSPLDELESVQAVRA